MVEIPENIDFKYNIKVYWDVLKKYIWLFIGILILVLIAEATNTADKFLFKSVVDNGTLFGAGTLTQSAFVQTLIYVAIIYAVVIIIRSLCRNIFMHMLNKLESRVIADIKRKFFNHIMRLSHSFYATHKTGSLINKIVRGGNATERMTDILIFNTAPLIFQLVIVGVSLLLFDKITALILLLTVLVFVFFSIYINHRQKPHSLAANDQEDFEKGNIADYFTNVDSIKYFGKEKEAEERYHSISDKTKKLAFINWEYYRLLESGQIFILGVGTFFLLYFPLLDYLHGTITLGTIIFIYTVYGNLVGPMFGFVYGIREYYRTMADFESLFKFGKIDNDIKDTPGAVEHKIINGNIEFEKITFKYGERKIFEDFTLKIPRYKKIALVGHSGSGKTTLVKLLYRFYDVNEGSIRVDGKNIKEYKQEWLRSEMSIVPQECVLFDDTIYNNIAFSNPSATKEQIMDAIRFAQMDKIIEKFPKKEDTIVGERGVKLSGGEKQRVSIARAILANKKILVLDEATSSLDSETEHEIQKDLINLMHGRTTIIIAHRLSTIMHADQIIVLKNGKIVQKGNHKQLIKRKGEYSKLWNLQKGGYIK